MVSVDVKQHSTELRWEGGMEVGEQGDYLFIAALSPPE